MRHDPPVLSLQVRRSHVRAAGLALGLGIGIGLGVPAWLLAGSVAPLNVFSDGTVASADAVNANFSALEGAVNDNDARLTRLLGKDGKTQEKAGASCKEILAAFPDSTNGPYFLDPDRDGDTSDARSVYCDMTGGGWTLMAINRLDGHATAFYKDWNTYKAGFGDVSSETADAGWLGNDNIHFLTREGTSTLKVVNNVGTHFYPGWLVLDETDGYRVFVPNSSGNRGNANHGFRYANGMRFSTWDRDQELSSTNCANDQKTGWWFHSCWYTLWASTNASSTYWHEPDVGSQDFTRIALWLR